MADSLSIVLPVWNEAANLPVVLAAIFSEVPRLAADFEVIAVDDGSSDGTPALLDAMARDHSRLRCVRHAGNRGYGSAIRSGIADSRKEWVFMMDADGQFGIGDLGALWSLRRENDFVIGYRDGRKDGAYRRGLGRLGNRLARRLIGADVADVNCGYKLFRGEDVRSLELASTGGLINSEILRALVARGKTRFAQVPVRHRPRLAGRQTGGRPSTVFTILREAASLLLR